jgi:hypothetical protein
MRAVIQKPIQISMHPISTFAPELAQYHAGIKVVQRFDFIGQFWARVSDFMTNLTVVFDKPSSEVANKTKL